MLAQPSGTGKARKERKRCIIKRRKRRKSERVKKKVDRGMGCTTLATAYPRIVSSLPILVSRAVAHRVGGVVLCVLVILCSVFEDSVWLLALVG